MGGFDLVVLSVVVGVGGASVVEVVGALGLAAEGPDAAFAVAAHGSDLLLGGLDDCSLPLLSE